MHMLNRLFELYYPIWMLLVNGVLAVVFFRIGQINGFRAAGILLGAGAACFVIVNATYALSNWGHLVLVKDLLIKTGPEFLLIQIVFAIIGSILSLGGSVILALRILRTREETA